MSDLRYFEPYLDPKALPNITQSFNDPLVGTVKVSGGNFTLLNSNGLLDQLLDKYIWLNRKVTIKRGYDDQDYADYTTMNVVTITGWRMNPQKVIFKAKNKFNALFEEIPAQTFSREDSDAFGGVAYGETYPDKIVGLPKPIAWGEFSERQAPILNLIREDKDFDNFNLNYDTPTKTAADMSPTAPPYNLTLSFQSKAPIEITDEGYTKSFTVDMTKPDANTAISYFRIEDDYWEGFYVYAGLKFAKVTSYNYDPENATATFYLNTETEGERLTETTAFVFSIRCPVYHYYVANHLVKSIDAIYVDKGGEGGTQPWIHLEDDEETDEGDWTRIMVPIPGYSSSTKVRVAFLSKDIDGGGDITKATLENHADVVEDILTNEAVLSSPFSSFDLDSASFTKSSTDRNYPVAIYLNEPTKAIDILKGIRQSVIAKLMFTPEGLIKYVAWNPENPVEAGIEELTISEILGDVVFEALLSDIYYGFIVKYAQDGQNDKYLEERYVYEPTKYLFKTIETKIIKTYLRNSSHAQRTAQRYTYFNRNLITKISFKLPHNYLRDETYADSVHTLGEYIKVTSERGPGQETEYGGEFGQYQKTYEILKVQDSSKGLSLGGDNIKGLSVNAGYWSDPSGNDPTGYWTNADGESVPGDDTTKNTSLYV